MLSVIVCSLFTLVTLVALIAGMAAGLFEARVAIAHALAFDALGEVTPATPRLRPA